MLVVPLSVSGDGDVCFFCGTDNLASPSERVVLSR